jgi:hypothetical protein
MATKQKYIPAIHRFEVGDRIRSTDFPWMVGTVIKQVTFSKRRWPFYVVELTRNRGQECFSDLDSELYPADEIQQ